MGNVWYTSDEHLEHEAILRFCNRPFKTVEECREAMLANHNELVKPGDIVYHVGDMFWRTCTEAIALDYMSRLNGNHYYVRGNHEELIDRSPKLRAKFVWIKERAFLHSNAEYGTPKIVLDHYAGLVWAGSHNGTWQLYGHSHGELSKAIPDQATAAKLNSFDIGVDCWDYKPVSHEQVVARMKAKWAKSGYTKHTCPACHHSFSNFSQYDEICSRCLERMVIDNGIQEADEDVKDNGV